MPPGAPGARAGSQGAASEGIALRTWRELLATWDLLRLELKVVTGNRALALALVELGVFGFFAVMALVRQEPWSTESFYNRTVLIPSLVPAIALGMAAVMGDKDSRQLEVTFVSQGGRYRVWTFRTAAILLSCAVSTVVLSTLTWAIIDRDFPAGWAALHALFPLAFAVCLTVCASVVTNSGSMAGLVSCLFILGTGFIFHSLNNPTRYDFFLNPFVPPREMIDPGVWLRTLVWNRTGLLVLAASALAVALLMLQRRERLV